MNQELSIIVRDAGFVEDAELGFKCTPANIERLAYYLISQVGALSFWTSANPSLSAEVTDNAREHFGLQDIDWNSPPKYEVPTN